MADHSADSSITSLIHRLEHGDRSIAPVELWNRFHERLERVARKVLRGSPQSVEGGEDVALDAVAAFLEGIYHGRFPHLHDRNELWTVLLTITIRRAINARRRAARGACIAQAPANSQPWLSDLLPRPDLVVEASDTLDHLLVALKDDSLREVARLRLNEYSSREIAERTGQCERTVERKLSQIRKTWRRALGPVGRPE